MYLKTFQNTMTRRAEVVLFLIAMYFKIHSASFVTYTGDEICSKTVHLNRETFAIQINYYPYSHRHCTAYIKPQFPYSAVLRLKSINGRCDSFLTINDQETLNYISFCEYYFPIDQFIDPNNQVSLYVNHSAVAAYEDQFEMVVYAYLDYDQRCDTPWYRCTYGRCIQRELYCDTDFSYCGDGRYQKCYNDFTETTPPSSFGNIVGVLALVITLIIVIVVVFYFCCCRVRRRFNQSNRNTDRPQTARDVYIIPTTHDNPDSVDYVIDYQKFAEPPAYETLEMTVFSGPSTHECANETSHSNTSQTNGSDNNFATNHGFVGDSAENETNSEIIIERQIIEVSTAVDNSQEEAISDLRADETNDSSAVNEAFVSTEDELPTYTDVLSNRERFRVV